MKFLARCIQIGVYGVLLLPFIFWSKSIYPFLYPKAIYFRVLVEMLFFLYIILALKDRSYAPRRTGLFISLSLYIAMAILTSFFGASIYQSFFGTIARGEGVFTLAHFFVFFIIMSSVFRTQKEWRALFVFFAILFFLENIIALGQIFKLPFVKTFGSSRPNGTLGNPAFFASYLLLGAGINFFLAHNPFAKLSRVFFFLNIFLGLVCLYFTLNRGAALGLMAGFVIFMLLQIVFNSETSVKKLYLKILFGLIAIIAVAHFISPNTSIIKSLTTYSFSNPSVANRLVSWNVGIKAFKERPVFGWGNENFSIVFEKYFDPEIVRDSGTYTWYDRAHNAFIDILVANGVFGLLAYIAIFFAALSAIRRSPLSQTEKHILYSLIIGYLAHIFFIFDTITTTAALFLILAYAQYLQAPSEREFMEPKKMSKAFFATGLAALIVCAYFFNVRPLAAAYYASKTALDPNISVKNSYEAYEKSFSISSPRNFELRAALGNYLLGKLTLGKKLQEIEPLITLAVDELKKTSEKCPKNVSVHFLLSELARMAAPLNPAYLRIAEDEALKIIELSPKRYQAYFALGKIKFAQNLTNPGILYFQKTLEFNPDFVGAHWNLAIAHILTENYDEAKKELALVQKLELAYMYQKTNLEPLIELLIEKEKYQMALDIYLYAVEEERYTDPYYFQKLGEMYTLLGKPDLAQQAFDNAKK